MDETLLSGWLLGHDELAVLDEASITLARRRARDEALAAGLGEKAADELAIIVSELGHNQLRHAGRGHLGFRTFARADTRGVEVVAADDGPGMASPTEAFSGQSRSSKRGLGIGLAGVLRLSDELDLDVRLGEGSCLWVRKLPREAPRAPQVAIFGRRLAGERVAGDDAAFYRSGSRLLLALADGLGHGAEARVAAHRAVSAIRGHDELDLAALVDTCQRGLEGARGCVLALLRVEGGRAEHAAVGDVSTAVFGPRRARRFVATAGILPLAQRRRAPRVDAQVLEPTDVIVMFSDGIKSRVDLSNELVLLRQPAHAIAEHVIANFARDHDDAMVIAVTSAGRSSAPR